jgi:hypothetical protein
MLPPGGCRAAEALLPTAQDRPSVRISRIPEFPEGYGRNVIALTWLAVRCSAAGHMRGDGILTEHTATTSRCGYFFGSRRCPA